ncbi:MAG TPA: hypothetical protein VEL74_11065 [Thermoanaerobaculia bacterium]|nr:hypothetical protein [Thermoanaerobaculia bacterium]
MKRIVLACVAALSLTGCFDVENKLSLNKDLSGKAGFAMKVNMEPMVLMMARMQRQMAGQEGDPTPAELAELKKSFKSTGTSPDKAKMNAEMDKFRKSLPPGVKLVENTFAEKELGFDLGLGFEFDNVSKLALIKLPGKTDAQGQAAPGPENPFDSPFGGLEVKDEGATILLTSKTVNPAAEAEQQSPMGEMDPEMKKQVAEMFKGLRLAYRIEAPFEVVEHNATRKQGNTLIWEYNIENLEKMKPEDLAQGVRVRYKK